MVFGAAVIVSTSEISIQNEEGGAFVTLNSLLT